MIKSIRKSDSRQHVSIFIPEAMTSIYRLFSKVHVGVRLLRV
jgi:hypothetical protein